MFDGIDVMLYIESVAERAPLKSQTLIQGMEGVRCVMNEDIITPAYVEMLKGKDRLRFKWMGKAGKNLYRIYGYRLT